MFNQDYQIDLKQEERNSRINRTLFGMFVTGWSVMAVMIVSLALIGGY